MMKDTLSFLTQKDKEEIEIMVRITRFLSIDLIDSETIQKCIEKGVHNDLVALYENGYRQKDQVIRDTIKMVRERITKVPCDESDVTSEVLAYASKEGDEWDKIYKEFGIE